MFILSTITTTRPRSATPPHNHLFPFIGLFLLINCQIMASDDVAWAERVARVGRVYGEALDRFQAETNKAEAAWRFGRACFDLAGLATNRLEKAAIAERGIAACRRSIALKADAAPAHYYLAMGLGQLADTRRNLGALRMVKEMEREFHAALDLDERFDQAGPDRSLGLLYWEAPVIISVGSRSKARQHLRRAVELAPDYPENRLNLVEACLRWGDLPGARREVLELEASLPEARRKFTGDAWTYSWRDWERRLNSARQRTGPQARGVESPRHED
jgi:tetratricopeptide (TPR) repeat protein